MERVVFRDLGMMDYKAAWDYQFALREELLEKKKNKTHPNNRKHYLLFCEHPHVFTLGKSGSMDNLLLNEAELAAEKIDFYKINRGGDITYHGPGQLVAYPIFDLDGFRRDLYWYVHSLEEVIIRTLAKFDIKGERIDKFTGVWIKGKNGLPDRKIAAIGVHNSRWVTMHGFALNVNTQLGFFKKIIPCGIDDDSKNVTSLLNETNRKIQLSTVKIFVKEQFKAVFGFEFA